MIVSENGRYYDKYMLWEHKLHQPYDYRPRDWQGPKEHPLLRKIMSHKILDSDNILLQYMLRIMEGSIVYCLNYIDILQNYLNYNWKNR